MTKIKTIFALGIWVTILPYLGFPYSLKNILFSISGLGLAIISFMLCKDLKAGEKEVKTFDNFSENSDFKEIEVEVEDNKKEF